MFGTRLASLILAFCLGFSMCGGLIAFGTMAAISKFRVRDLEKHGIEIPDEAFMTENPEVDLLNLSIVDFINEVKYISSISNEANLNDVQERYGLIFHEKLDAVLSDETREMPLKQLFSAEGFGHILGSVYIGNVENYTCYDAEGNVGGNPKDDTSYWMTADGVKITGIEDIIADFSLNDFLSGNINTNNLFDEICIGDIFGYTKNGEEWYDKDGNKVTGVIGAFAGSSIHSISTDINDVMIGDVLDYQQNEDGDWYKENDAGELEKVSGVMAVFAGSKINEIGDHIETAKVGELLGYELKEGKWYKENTETGELEKVSGVMAVFADSDINGIGQKVEESKLGELLGYELKDGKWLRENEDTGEFEKVTGVLAVFADCNIDGIGDKLESANLGEILGYEKNEKNEWCKADADGNLVKVTGAMAVFADSNIDGVGNKIEQTEVGKLLGYDKIEGVWYQPADVIGDDGGRVPVDGFMSKISDSTINNMDGVFDTLVIGDVVDDEAGGIFAIIDPDTKIDEIGSAVNDSIMDSPLQFFINEGLISFETESGSDMSGRLDTLSTNDIKKIYPTDDNFETQKGYYSDIWTEEKDSSGNVLYYTVPNWRTQPLSKSFAYIVSLLASPFG